MKKLILIGATALSLTAFIAMSHAGDTKMHKKWMCETNATKSSNQAEMKADESMAKMARSAKDAFDYALKHCRDCTKISCSMSK
jgi:hypothetical protein